MLDFQYVKKRFTKSKQKVVKKMKKILIASTNSKVIRTVENACKSFPAIFSAENFGSTESIISYINYELPEIKILDYTSTSIDCCQILEEINGDAWLHFGGIIAVCRDRAALKDLEERKDENILCYLTADDFEQNFLRLLNILYQNQQFLYTRGMQEIIQGEEQGSFVCGNNLLDMRFYINFLVSYLYTTNRISDDDRSNLRMTLTELMMNAIEHGNLKISYEEKTRWLISGKDMITLVNQKASEEQNRNKKIYVSYAIRNNASAFRIRDDGDGFDWKKHVDNTEMSTETHGRGISLSNQCVKKITYNEKGNQVTFSIDNKQYSVNSVPGIMEPFDAIEYKDKEVIWKQNEMCNDLFFIVSGRFAVYADNRLTTVLTPNDMFIGEMAFLLNDRRTATVVSLGTSKLIKVPKTAFLSLIRKNPHYGIFLSKMLAQRLAKQTQTTNEIRRRLNDVQGSLAKHSV